MKRALPFVALLAVTGCAHLPLVEGEREQSHAPTPLAQLEQMALSAAPNASPLWLTATANRPAGEFPMFLMLNGQPTYVGVLTSTGASVTNATTGVPFTLNGGEVLKFVCDAEAWLTPGGTASLTFSSANLGHPIPAKTAYFMITKETTTTIALISTSGTANCGVWRML